MSYPQVDTPRTPKPSRVGLDARDEFDLVTRVQAGDVEAYGELMRVHVRDVRGFIALRAPAPHLIDEISHEAFVVAFNKIDDFKAGTSFKKWIRTIAWQILRREVKKFATTERNLERFSEHLAIEQARRAKQDDASLDDLERCLEKLPQAQRELVNLKYTEGRSTTEMADAVQRSEDWVRTTLYRVRNQLRDCMNTLATNRS